MFGVLPALHGTSLLLTRCFSPAPLPCCYRRRRRRCYFCLSRRSHDNVGIFFSSRPRRSVLEVTSLLGRLLPTLCPETISHFYVGLRPATAASSPLSFHADATGTGAAVVTPEAVVAEHHSVPWLLLAMPLPLPVFREAGGGDSNLSTDRFSDRSTSRRSPGRQEDGFLSSTTGDDGGSAHADGGRHHREFSTGPAGEAAEGVSDDAEVSTRFVCHVETARLLATTAMGVLGNGGWEEEGREECSRVLQAGEAFFAAFGRLYCG